MLSDEKDISIWLPGMRNVGHDMTGMTDQYDSDPGYIYRPSLQGVQILSKELDAIPLAKIKAKVVCEYSGSNGVRTFTIVRESREGTSQLWVYDVPRTGV